MPVLLPPEIFDPNRLAAVGASGLVDTASEEAFDRLARLAVALLEVPLAFVTVVDDRRSWYKSCIGLPATADRSGPVEESFCQCVIGADEALIVDDAAADPRTRDNRAIKTMGVAAWAGFPVRATTGEVLGTMCVVDTVPHHWSERDIQVLDTLAAAASGEIALRVALADERSARVEMEAAAQANANLSAGLRESNDRLSALARILQTSLLPPHLPAVPGIDVAACYAPAGGATTLSGTSTTCSRAAAGPGACSSATSAARARRPLGSRPWPGTRSGRSPCAVYGPARCWPG